MIKTSNKYKEKMLNNKSNSDIKINNNSINFLNEEDNKMVEKIESENLHEDMKDSPLVKSAIPEVIVVNPTIKEVLKTTEKHTKANDDKKSDDEVSLLRFMRKKQRGNSIDSNYNIWSKEQCLDVVYQTALGLQDIDMMWVHVSEDNVEYNKKYAGQNSIDYKIMKKLYDKYGEHWLGEDGQQTYSTLDFLVRPLIDSNIKEEKFTDEITFTNEQQDGSCIIHKFPNKRNNKTTYVISEWPQDRKNKILNKRTTIKKYTKILWRNVSDLFKNKNKNSSPNPAEVRSVDDGLLSLVTSYVTSTKEELKNRFEQHEKSIPLDLENKKGEFVSLGNFFNPLGEKFEDYISNNTRCGNEEIFQKLYQFELKRRNAKDDGKTSIISSDSLSSMVTKPVKNYKDEIKKLQEHCRIIELMFDCFDSVTDRVGIKKITNNIGFLSDLYSVIVDKIEHACENYQVSGTFNGTPMSYLTPVTFELSDMREFTEEFVKEYSKIVAAKVKWRKDASSLSSEENKLKDIYDYQGSFKGRALSGRKNFWNDWWVDNKDNFLKNGIVSPKDLKRFYSTPEVVAIIISDEYTTFDGKDISPTEAWNGNKYQGDHWDVSYKNGGFTVLWNGKGLNATQNKQKSSKNADEYLGVIV